MMKKRLNKIYAALLLLSVFFTGCINEDLSDCPPKDLRLWVQLTHNTDKNLVDAYTRASVERAVLYIFDEQSNFVTLREIHKPQFGTKIEIVDWQRHLHLGNTYKFIVWFNNDIPYLTNPTYSDFSIVKPHKNDAQLYLDIPDSRIVDFELPKLYYGNHSEEINLDDPVIDILLTQNTNAIDFTVNGLTTTTDTYKFSIEDNNGIYDFDNKISSLSGKDMFSYVAVSKFTTGSDQLLSLIHTLKLADNRNPIFTLKNTATNEILYPSYPGQENNLIEMIKKAYKNQVDFNSKHNFSITINFDTKMTASVVIDGWNMNESDNEIIP